MNEPKSIRDELFALLNRSKASFREAMRKLAEATARNSTRRNARLDDLRILAGQTMTLADLYGRRRALLWTEYAQAGVKQAARVAVYCSTYANPIVPAIPFREAISDFKKRVPELAETAEAVADAYMNRHAFACARSADIFVTQRVQEKLVDALNLGWTMDKAVAEIAGEAENWTNAYAETVYRTNVHTAYANGEREQAMDPVAVSVLPAWIYEAVGDVDTRENCMAANGMIAAKRDHIWERWYPPIGYNCRASVREMDVYDLEEEGRLTSSGQVYAKIPAGIASGAIMPDKGFESRRIIA
jgi:SPP1 gp7 family putative phage head morphogenesis protein